MECVAVQATRKLQNQFVAVLLTELALVTLVTHVLPKDLVCTLNIYSINFLKAASLIC